MASHRGQGGRGVTWDALTTDGSAWGAPVKATTNVNQYDVQPHPILHGTPGHVVLSWGRQRAAGSDYDIWPPPPANCAGRGGELRLRVDRPARGQRPHRARKPRPLPPKTLGEV
jgi:hypothetical protein